MPCEGFKEYLKCDRINFIMTSSNFTNYKKLELGQGLYPDRLLNVLGKKAPKEIYFSGNIELLKKKAIGFCGSRSASPQSLNVVKDCVEQAVRENIVIISGNAKGIDLTAHYTALENNGETIFVLPEGIEYFRIKRELKDVWNWDKVLVISQFEPNAIWQAYRAMTRNEIIVSLSNSMIVIEAGEKGGTLNAGMTSLKLKIPVYVAKYGDNPDAKGNEILISKGAEFLGKSSQTDKANMSKVFKSISGANNIVQFIRRDIPEENLQMKIV